ncbi:Glycerate kinase [Thermosinus carboxydivorans Nor1]|uniref:Glycerate kinase n=1 Tax=Thermosinus carboxydivorans Nor1 TaxID=401526 RepID=A1HTZ8_9FIRM|nr:glycerate kinase [Thermosinus carboxydivorans]EAX46519.1 Glycerate kinase [Thermosinus carboxydivorans Nor1]
MRVVIAPDSFKGSVSALGVANAVANGVRAVFPDAEIIKVPIADGGEGTVEALVTATGGQIVTREVVGPLGEPVMAHWGVLGDGDTAVIEMAAASGLTLVPKEKRDPRITTTYGTGQLIKAVLDRGIRKIIIGIGGSATNDGGTGMAKALGARFLDASGQELPPGGAALARLAKIDLSGLDERLRTTTILVACDVDNPLCGPRGASAVYGPQKGATPEMVKELDAALKNFAAVATVATGKDVADYPGAGAAGGLGAGLLFFTGAQLRPGVEIVLETTGFASLVATADLVITGEGRTDFQTAYGKAPVGVAKVAKQYGVPVVCLSGGLGDGADDVLAQGVDALMSVVPQPMALDECMAHGAELIEQAAARLCRLVKVGLTMSAR